MTFVTVYLKQVRRRKGPDKGKVVGIGIYYRTKDHTPHHGFLRSKHPEALTYENPTHIYTEMLPGLNLGVLPVVIGGTIVARGTEVANGR